MKNNPIESALGLCAGARRLVTGVNEVKKAMTEGRAYRVFADPAASAGSLKKLEDGCRYYGVPLYIFREAGQPGKAIGDTSRMCCAITDGGFAKMADNAVQKLPEGILELRVPGEGTEVKNG